MPFLQQSTVSTIRFGPCLDITDGVTEETALTLAQADMRLSKNGGAFAQKNAAGNATHDSDGWYSTSLNAIDTDTVGELILNVHQPANMLPVWQRWYVVEEVIYDALFRTGANGWDGSGRVDVGSWLGTAAAAPTVAGVPEVDITHLGGVAQSLTDLKDFADAGYDPATNKITGCVLTDTVTTNTDMRGTDSAALASVLGALADAAAAGDPTSADTLMQYVKQLINILEGTDGISVWDAEQAPANLVNISEVLRAIHADVTGLAGSVMRGTDSAALASVATEARLAELDAANLPTDVDAILVDTNSLNDTKIPDTISLAAIADAIWDELMAGHLTDQTFGLANQPCITGSAAAGAAGTITLDANASAVADLYNGALIKLVGGTGAGQTRRITDYAVTTKIATIEPNWITNPVAGTDYVIEAGGNADLRTATQASVDAIEADTNELQGDWVDGGRLDLLLDAIPTTAMRGTDSAALASVATEARLAELDAANLPTDVDAILVDTNSLNDTKIPDTISLAAINAEVDTALDTTIAELGVAVPATTPTVRTALMLMYMALRNQLKVQTSATDALEIYNDAGALITKKLITDDGSDYTEAKMS